MNQVRLWEEDGGDRPQQALLADPTPLNKAVKAFAFNRD